MRSYIVFLLFAFALFNLGQAQEKQYKIHTVAFYNLENLFDYENDPITFDDDRTPEGKDHWTPEIYAMKLKNMAKVLVEIGQDLTGTSPTIIGVCEVENRRVLEDLLNQDSFKNLPYDIIHYDSPDRRGIDVALLYKKNLFTPTYHKVQTLYLYDSGDKTKRIYTRDALVVSGQLEDEPIHILVNHWPSRSGGEARSRDKRIKAAQLNRSIIDSLFSENPYAKIITMGDFNDDPTNESITTHLKAKKNKQPNALKTLYNPMYKMHKNGLGSLAWRDSWNLFDQIILSTEWLKKDFSSYRFYQAGIYNKPYLANPTGQYKGYPFRSFTNSSFTNGYSDHFPVYVYLIKEIN